MLLHAHQFVVALAHGGASILGFASSSLRVHVGVRMAAMDARILSILAIVTRELEKPQLVRHRAGQLRLSPSRFEHLFKKETGQAFKAFVRANRMTRAKDMLQDPTLRIKEVAASVGYSDVSNFAHDFRKQYGQPASGSRSPSP